VLATAAEAIRVITALVYPILPDAASKVWQQLGQGNIADAANNAFLLNLAWGGLRPGTKFGEPAPLFPRAEKDAITRMQNLEDENNRSAIDAASGQDAAASRQNEPAVPAPPPASPSVNVVQDPRNEPGAGVPKPIESTPRSKETAPTPGSGKTVATAHVSEVPAELTSSRLATTPGQAPADKPLTPAENSQNPPTAPTQPAQITIDDFAKVELRVAQVLVAERIPKADKLLRLEIDLGYEKRQILAGIAEHYAPEKLIGRKIVIVANLAPRKMRGLESNGMLLAASLPPDGAPVLAGFLEDVPLGARLK
jgi:methionyl-tRNA synthetase